MSFTNRKSSRMLVAFVVTVVLTLTGTAISAQAQTYTVLYDNPGPPGIANPNAEAIAQGRDGNLYTTSPDGGTDFGTFFKISPSGEVTVVNDTTICCSGLSGVTLGTDGNFYGTNQSGPNPGTQCGFTGCGQIFKITPAGVETVLYNFTNTAEDGYDPQSAPIEATNGKFYGTTFASAGNYISVAYSITSTGTFSTVHVFTNAEGQEVYGGLVQGSDGNLYGVASRQGANSYGTIFKMSTAGAVTVLHSFTGGDGAYPYRPLIQASDGNFYGTTPGGGTYGVGVVFKITPGGKYTVLHTFQPNTDDGNEPTSSLIQATDGKLYGVTFSGGGTANEGIIYSITTGGSFTTVHSFCQVSGCLDGRSPNSPLKQNTNGVLYGTTYYGGTNCPTESGCGVIFSLNIGKGAFVSLASTSGKEGTQINIFGQGFSSSSVVKFGGTQAKTVTRSGTTFMTATVPAEALTGSVTVTTGATTLTSSQTFKVTPTFTSFAPPSGPVGTLVTITGTGLTQATKVTFDGKAAAFTVVSDTEITATVPTTALTGKIAVTTKGGSASSATSFTVN